MRVSGRLPVTLLDRLGTVASSSALRDRLTRPGGGWDQLGPRHRRCARPGGDAAAAVRRRSDRRRASAIAHGSRAGGPRLRDTAGGGRERRRARGDVPQGSAPRPGGEVGRAEPAEARDHDGKNRDDPRPFRGSGCRGPGGLLPAPSGALSGPSPSAYGNLVGVICFHFAGRGALPDAEFDSLRKFCDSAATALYNARVRAGLHHLAYTDPLTGLPNRRRLEEEIENLRGGRGVDPGCRLRRPQARQRCPRL